MLNYNTIVSSIKSVVSETPNLAAMCRKYIKAADPYASLKANTSSEASESLSEIVSDPELQKDLLTYVYGDKASKLWTKDGICFTTEKGVLVTKRGKGGFAASSPMAAAVFFINLLSLFFNVNLKNELIRTEIPLGMVRGHGNDELYTTQSAMLGGAQIKVFDAKWFEKDISSAYALAGMTEEELKNVMGHLYPALMSDCFTVAAAIKHPTHQFLMTDKFSAECSNIFGSLPANLFLVKTKQAANTHFISSDELTTYVKIMEAAVKNAAFKTSKIDETTTVVIIGGVEFIINKLGVFDGRGRRLNGMLFNGSTLELTNTFGAFLELLLAEAETITSSQQKLLSAYARNISLIGQWDSEDESGGQDVGDRAWYNFYTTSVYSRSRSWKISGSKITLSASNLKKYTGDAHVLNAAALAKFNLIPMHKGKMPYVNGILMNLRMDFVAEEYKIEVLTGVIKSSTGLTLVEGLRSIFPELASLDDHQLVELAKSEVIVSLSSKVAKLSKRTGLVMAKHAEALASAHTPVESRAFRLDGQGDIFGFSPVHVRTVVFAERGIYPPGLSVIMDPNSRPLIANRQSETDTLALFDKSAENYGPCVEGFNTIETALHTSYSYAHLEQEVSGHTATGVYVEKDEAVFCVAYQNKAGETVRSYQSMPTTGMLTNIKTTVNAYNELTVRIEYSTLENEFKWRSNVKTMMVGCFTGLSMVYNELNSGLPAGLQDVIMADAIKSKDLVQRNLDIIFQTIRSLPQGSKIVQLFNKVVGLDNSVGLSFNAIAAAMGLYDELIAEFEREYSKAIWLYTRSDESMWSALKTLYTNRVGHGWNKVDASELTEQFPEGTEILANGDVSKASTDILVFYVLPEGTEGPRYVFYQRTFALVGVKLGVKTEISTVAQSSGTTRTMAAVARTIATGMCGVNGDPKAAVRIMQDNQKTTEKFVALHACAKHIPFNISVEGETTEPARIAMFSDTELSADFSAVLAALTDEIKSAAANGTLTLDMIVEELGFFSFELGADLPWLYLPAVGALDAAGQSRSTLNGATRALFEYAINGVNSDEIKKLALKVGSMIKAFVTNDCFTKQLLQGRLAAQAKAVGAPGVGIDEVWVLRTGAEFPNSFYNQLKKAFKVRGINNIDGQKVAMSRSPLPFPAILQVKVVEAGSWQSFAVTPHTYAVNPMAAYISAGDFDGRITTNSPEFMLYSK